MSSPMIRTFGSRSISSIIASRIASRYDFSLMLTLTHRPWTVLRNDVGKQFFRRRHRAFLGELHCCRDHLRGLVFHRLHVVIAESADFGETVAEDDDRVAIALLFDFFFRSVRLQDVRRAVA